MIEKGDHLSERWNRRSSVVRTAPWVVLFCVVTASTFVHSGSEPRGPIKFELTGTVRDIETKEPLEGAYVVASYREVVVGTVAIRNWCVKTKGVYTGKDGKFNFPVEKRDGWSPAGISAIKPGYARDSIAEPRPDVWKKQGPEAYTGRDIFLRRQDPAKLHFNFGYGDEYCDHAATREDAAAAVEFLKIQLLEKTKYGVGNDHLDAGWKVIRQFEALPSASSATKK